MKPRLPFELVLSILKDEDPRHLYLLNKEYSMEYIRIRISTVANHTKMPFYDLPLYPYFTFISKLYLDIRNLEDMEKWAAFNYSELTNCKLIRLFFNTYERKGERITRLQSSSDYLELKIFVKIKEQLPHLRGLESAGNLSSRVIVEMFKDSELQEFRLNNNSLESVKLLNQMKDLSHLILNDSIGLEDLNVVFPKISRLEIKTFEDAPSSNTLGFFKKMAVMFPILKEFMCNNFHIPMQPTVEVASLLPSSIDILQMVLIDTDISWTSCQSFHDTIIFNHLNSLRGDDLSVIPYLQRCSNNWVFAMGSPTFLIITNISKFSDVSKYTYALDSSNMDGVTPLERKIFNSRRINSIYIHISHQMFNNEDPEYLDMLANYAYSAIKLITDDDNILDWACEELGSDNDSDIINTIREVLEI